MSRKRKVSDAVELMDRWYGNIPGWDEMLAEEELKMQIGQALYDLRGAVGLSQTDLAKLVGTNQSIISKVENADYDGNSMEILKRACLALHTRIKITCTTPKAHQPECQIALGA